MKRNELKCPNCKSSLEDHKSHMTCGPCNKNYQITITGTGVKQFFFGLLPACIGLSTLVVMNWKVRGFLDLIQGEMVFYSLIAVCLVVMAISTKMIKNQMKVGMELTEEK